MIGFHIKYAKNIPKVAFIIMKKGQIGTNRDNIIKIDTLFHAEYMMEWNHIPS